MVTIESALHVLKICGGDLDIETGRLIIPSEVLGKENVRKAVHVLKEAGPDRIKSVSAQFRCQGCQRYDSGPDSFGKGIIHWCGPWSESDGERWFNIAKLQSCPLGKWGDTKKVVVH